MKHHLLCSEGHCRVSVAAAAHTHCHFSGGLSLLYGLIAGFATPLSPVQGACDSPWQRAPASLKLEAEFHFVLMGSRLSCSP